jgi:lipoyl(octanoyl) transferase
MSGLRVALIGCIDYQEALDLQEQLAAQRQADRVDDTLLILEHPPVITLGARGRYENIYLPREELARLGVQIHEVSRGGDVTYHGPGQVVGYPIIKLTAFPGGVRAFVCAIETAAIRLLADHFAITATAGSGKLAGVWVGERKIMAIGIAVRHGVSMHGFALNVNTDLDHFNWINPCGLSKGVTSIAQVTGSKQDMEKVSRLAAAYVARHLTMPSREIGRGELLAAQDG